MDTAQIELRQLRYFVAVAEELHFGRAAERLHMSQSPLSRAIRELERELDLVLFVRTTRRVELTDAGAMLLERSRKALSEIDSAITDAQRSARPDVAVHGVGYGPFSRPLAARIVEELRLEHSDLTIRLDEEVTADSLRRLAAHDLAAAIVQETPAAARHPGVRIDTLRDEPLLAALPSSHEYANADEIPIAVFAADVVLLPREPPGRLFNTWFRAVVRAAGFELERTLETLSAPWDRRLLPVANGDAVSVFVAEWAADAIDGVVAVPFASAVSFPLDLASSWPPSDDIDALIQTACRVRDSEGWLTQRAARSELPGN